METLIVAKRPRNTEPLETDPRLVEEMELPLPDTSDDDKDTTWKLRGRVAAVLRKIQGHLRRNQQDTIELFMKDFENYLARLQERDMKDRLRKRPEAH